jgi:acyl-CoA synthetase (AMP-forming)/AMP-acid ligase II
MNTTRLPLLPAVVRERAQSTPAAPAVVAGASDLSYADLHGLVAALNGRLRHHGVRPGDRVAILGLNSIEWVVAFLACLDAGAVAAPLSYRLSPFELEQQIALLQPRLVLADEELLGPVTAGARSAGSTLLPLTGLDSSQETVWAGRSAGAVTAAVSPASHALISFTSGSTGAPKGAVITHEGLVAAAGAYVEAMATSEDDRTLAMVPLFHNTGFCDQLAHMLLVGGTVDLLPAFGVAAAREALLRRPSTFLIGVPGILRLLATSANGEEIFSACRIACYGGSPMPEAWIEEFASHWPHLRLYNSYGLTEFTSVSHLLDPGDLDEHAHTVGRPVPGAQQRIVGPDGAPLPAGEIGSLLLAGPSRMKKYWRDRARTSEVIRGRWLVTGDLGSVREDGFLTLVGRASEVINRGGEKVSPLQVEAALSLLPEIAEAAVVGAPHPVFGERVVAFVALRDGGELDPEAVRAQLARTVADFAIPERFFVLDDLPRGSTGKVDRRALCASAEAAVTAESARC